MKPRLLTPGPTPVPEETLLDLARPVFYHRSPQFRQILAEVLDDLRYVFCTRNHILPLTASGTGAWRRPSPTACRPAARPFA